MTVAIPFSRWGAQPYITYPFLFPIATTDAVRTPDNEPIGAEDKEAIVNDQKDQPMEQDGE